MKISKEKAFKVLEGHLRKQGAGRGLPYLFHCTKDGYLFGPPMKAGLSGLFVLVKSCYVVDGSTGKVSRPSRRDVRQLEVKKHEYYN